MLRSYVNTFIRRFLDLLKKLQFPVNIISKLFICYHKYILRCLKKTFNLAFSEYKLDETSSNLTRFNSNINKVIWIFWWQGTERMPHIVKKCINSIINNSNNHKVIILTKHNIDKYTNLPQFIYYKLKSGRFNLTEFSDILRFNILKNYGGLWVDSTVYCVSRIPSRCFGQLYTASGGCPKYLDNISLGRWTSFLIGGYKGQPLFVFMNDLLLLYWKYNNSLIDYFLTDYALDYAYINNIGGFKNYITHSVKPNPSIYEMEQYLNKPFNLQIYKDLIKNTFLFKLTYKKKIKINRKNTFYYHLTSKE